MEDHKSKEALLYETLIEDMEKYFLEMYDNKTFDWDEIEDNSHFLYERTVDEDHSGNDGYIDVVKVFKVKGRFFKVTYWLGGKDLDEDFDLSNPIEVYPYEVTTIEYREEKLEDK